MNPNFNIHYAYIPVDKYAEYEREGRELWLLNPSGKWDQVNNGSHVLLPRQELSLTQWWSIMQQGLTDIIGLNGERFTHVHLPIFSETMNDGETYLNAGMMLSHEECHLTESHKIIMDRINRDLTGMPCPCGGYADRVDCSAEEVKKYNCARSYPCCARAFLCRVLQKTARWYRRSSGLGRR